LRVVHIVPTLDPSRGGPSRSVIGLARAQARAGAEVRSVTGRAADAEAPVAEGIDVRCEPLLSHSFSVPGTRLDSALRTAIDAADLVHVHSVWNGVITRASMLARRHRKPLVLSPRGMLDEHNMRERRLLKRLYYLLLERRNLNRLTALHFLDDSEKHGCRWLKSARCRPCIVQPNGLDVDALRRQLDPDWRMPNSAGVSDSALHFVYLGRLNWIKGLELQIDVVSDLRERGFDAHLHWVGPDDGQWRPLRDRAEKQGLDRALHWHGPIYGSERLQWLRAADAVLLTSHYECNSNTAAEAMAVGGLLVAVEPCHLDKPAAAGAALVVPRERQALVAALAELLPDPSRVARRRLDAERYAAAELDWTPMGERMVAFYDRLLERPDAETRRA